MSILEGLIQLFETIQAQVVNIPTDNVLGLVYVALNAVMLLFAMLFGAGGEGGFSIFPF